MGAYEAQSPPSADFDSDSDVDGSDFLAWQRGYGTTVGATKPDGNSDDDEDVDASDLAAWQVSFGNLSAAPRSFAASSEQLATPSVQRAITAPPLGLRAELVDAAIAMDQALRPKTGADLAPSALLGEDYFDSLPRSARWSQSLPWHGRSEIADHLFRGQINKTGDHGFYLDAVDPMDEELLDELFAKDELVELL
jgi:hypothetical protein